jgi:hypothetical protein
MRGTTSSAQHQGERDRTIRLVGSRPNFFFFHGPVLLAEHSVLVLQAISHAQLAILEIAFE